ncbi:hypothetical protein [Pseudonocardia xishanensis]|uniref:hypothetical protein n=1 Tax=Pseudonocardia xishanensis TaxID=630995 RepID=UPI0031F197DF
MDLVLRGRDHEGGLAGVAEALDLGVSVGDDPGPQSLSILDLGLPGLASGSGVARRDGGVGGCSRVVE